MKSVCFLFAALFIFLTNATRENQFTYDDGEFAYGDGIFAFNDGITDLAGRLANATMGDTWSSASLMQTGLQVSIDTDQTGVTGASVSGEQRFQSSPQTRQLFGIMNPGTGQDKLKDLVRRYNGKTPDRANTHGSEYEEFGQSYPVRILFKPNGVSRISEIISTPIVVTNIELFNNRNVSQDAFADLSTSVSTSSSHTSATSQSVGISQSVSYGLSFLGTGGGGETSMSYSKTWSESHTEETTYVVTANAGFNPITLAPNSGVRVTLTADQGNIEVDIEYRVHITGFVAAYYQRKYNGYNYYFIDVKNLMDPQGLPRNLYFTETLKLDHYYTTSAQIYDFEGTLIRSG